MGSNQGYLLKSFLLYLLEKNIFDFFLTFQAFDNQVREQAVSSAPGKVMRVYTDRKNQLMTAETFIPYCSMAQAQLSFHGHRDAVKFFVSVPGNGGLTSGLVTSGSPTSAKSPPGLSASPKCIGEAGIEASSMLVMSGGEGYIDFRIGKSLNSTQYGILRFFNLNDQQFILISYLVEFMAFQNFCNLLQLHLSHSQFTFRNIQTI